MKVMGNHTIDCDECGQGVNVKGLGGGHAKGCTGGQDNPKWDGVKLWNRKPEVKEKRPHNWILSRLGHGEHQCTYCLATNREIVTIGDINHCPNAPTPEEAMDLTNELDPLGVCDDVIEPDDVVYLRDFYGTGSLHTCLRGDPGALRYVRED